MTHSVYLPGSSGPFRCDNCKYFQQGNKCNEPNIVGYAEKGMFGLSLSSDSLAEVDPAGCSDYFEKKDSLDSSQMRNRNKLDFLGKD